MFRRMSFSEILMNMRNFIEIKRKEITFWNMIHKLLFWEETMYLDVYIIDYDLILFWEKVK
jgi:hypothetical protein